jgi:3-oxoadipate enol-lactonase
MVGGVRLAYRVAGAVDAPPMVLLHGLGSDSSTWDEVIAALADSHRIYAPDLRGQGDSDRPGTYSFELMRDDILGFLDALDLTQVTLVGHSMGGTIALLFAEKYPDRLVRLIIEDSPPPFVGADPIPVPSRPDSPVPYDWPLAEAIIRQLNNPDPAWWDQTGTISVPTLIIAGGPDSHVPQDKVHEVAARIPESTLVTIRAGHQVHRNRPGAFIASVQEFLSIR